jgi:predicted O-methyltransferase YrrM
MVNLELSNPNSQKPIQPAKNFKYFIKRSYLARLFLIPYRIYYALSLYLPIIGQIFKWGFVSREFTNYTYDLTETNLVYLAQMLALVTSLPISEIEKYLQEAQEDKRLLAHIIETTNNSDLKTIADAQCRFGRRLGWYALVRALKPKTIVETGIDKGLGSVLLCSALSKNAEEGYEGRYFGTDINPDAGYLLSEPYSNYGEILYGDSIASLEKFDRPIDLFINDSDHSGDYEYQEYLTIQDKLAPNAIILGDNAEVTDRLSLFSKETGRDFLFFAEKPKDHWCPGSGIGISFKRG